MYCMSLHRSDCQIMIMYNAVTQYLRQTLDSSSNFGKGQSSLLCIDGIQIQSWVYCLQAAQIRTWNSYNYYLLHAKHTVWFPLYVSYQHGKAFSANKRITPTISMDFLYSTEPKTLPRPQRGKFQRLSTKQMLPPGRSWGYKHATYINWCPNCLNYTVKAGGAAPLHLCPWQQSGWTTLHQPYPVLFGQEQCDTSHAKSQRNVVLTLLNRLRIIH